MSTPLLQFPNNKRKKAKDLVIPVLIMVILLVAQVIHNNHPGYFPRINEVIFEQLIQLNSTILGFTLVGMLYYLGKFDDKKREYIRQWLDLADFASRSAIKSSRISDTIVEALNKTNVSKTPIISGFVHSLSEIKKEGLDRVDWFNKYTPKVIDLFGIRDAIVYDMKFITVYIGIAIAVSFLALSQYSYDLNPHAWRWLLVALSFMTGSIFYYYSEWKSMRELSDIIDNTTLAWERANSNLKLNDSSA
jgi:ABC-type multidrug transport system fused ATPase/permease subunit